MLTSEAAVTEGDRDETISRAISSNIFGGIRASVIVNIAWRLNRARPRRFLSRGKQIGLVLRLAPSALGAYPERAKRVEGLTMTVLVSTAIYNERPHIRGGVRCIWLRMLDSSFDSHILCSLRMTVLVSA